MSYTKCATLKKKQLNLPMQDTASDSMRSPLILTYMHPSVITWYRGGTHVAAVATI